MDWKEYEREVFKYLRQSYPEANISFDQKIVGRYSKVERQIDILVEGSVADYEIKIVIDCKFFSKNIDVKDVESFCSMVDDVDAHQGILITKKGYSQAAINRAYYGSNKIELDIINFDDLQDYQSIAAMPYINHFMVIVPAPFGWVADLNNSVNSFATYHQRGISLEEAQMKDEWMYMNFYLRLHPEIDIESLIEEQNKAILESEPNTTFRYSSKVKRDDGVKTKIRIAETENDSLVEVVGFIQFEEAIFFIVLLTPRELLNKNFRKLQFMLKFSFPDEISFNNSGAIRGLLDDIPSFEDREEQANGYYQVGIWNEEMHDIENAMINYKKAVEHFPTHYSNLKGIIAKTLSFGLLEDSRRYSIQLFEVKPTNPTVPKDFIDIYLYYEKSEMLIDLFKELISKHSNHEEVLGNLNYHLGLLYYNLDDESNTTKYMHIAKKHFLEILPVSHQVFEALTKFMG